MKKIYSENPYYWKDFSQTEPADWKKESIFRADAFTINYHNSLPYF